MDLIEVTQFKSTNGEDLDTQQIKEALLRRAVAHCDYYPTDVLIFFNVLWKEFFDRDAPRTEITLYFTQYGISWDAAAADYEDYLYRSKAIITTEGEKMTLRFEPGNC
jgi:hypothetical protein